MYKSVVETAEVWGNFTSLASAELMFCNQPQHYSQLFFRKNDNRNNGTPIIHVEA